MKKFLFVILFLLCSLAPLTGQAIGQITEPIVITSALRGHEATAVLNLLNSEEIEINIELSTEGQIAPWTGFYTIEDKEFKNPVTSIKVAANSYQDATVLFKIPTDTANGLYTGFINAAYKPAEKIDNKESGSIIAQEISREVKITVSDKEEVKLEASIIPDKYDFKVGEPMSLRIIYDNRSNIALSPQLEIKIKDGSGQTVYNSIYPYPEGLAPVKPQSQLEIPTMQIPTIGFTNNRHQAFLTFSRNDQVILEKNFNFSVGLVSENKGFGTILTRLFSEMSANTKNLILLGLAFALIIIAIISLKRYLRLKKKLVTGSKKNNGNGAKKKNDSNSKNGNGKKRPSLKY